MDDSGGDAAGRRERKLCRISNHNESGWVSFSASRRRGRWVGGLTVVFAPSQPVLCAFAGNTSAKLSGHAAGDGVTAGEAEGWGKGGGGEGGGGHPPQVGAWNSDGVPLYCGAMAKKPTAPQPLLPTPPDQMGKIERFKLEGTQLGHVLGTLPEEVRDFSHDDISDEAEQLAKSHGIYLEYNRAKTGREKDYMYMVRISVPGGGGFNRDQWRVVDETASKYTTNPYGQPSIRLTTRQNIQLHWIKKEHLADTVRSLAQTGFFTLNGCGDNTRNVMACPLSKYSDLYNAHAQAHKYGEYFELPAEPHLRIFQVDTAYSRFYEESLGGGASDPVASHGCGGAVRATGKFQYGPRLLNRKFKIAFSAVHRDADTGDLLYDDCIEALTQDMGITPIMEGPRGSERLTGFQLYVGGGQGEKNGKPTFAALAQPMGITTPENLLPVMDAVVKVHQEWGDRKNRHWARLKYVIYEQGIKWYQDRVREMGVSFDAPNPALTPGPRMMHHGWQTLPSTGKTAYGAYIECGRLVDSAYGEDPAHASGNVTGNGRLKSMVRDVMDKFDDLQVLITANQDLLFTNIEPDAREDFEAALAEHGHGKRQGKTYSRLRLLSGACVGLPTCRLSYTDSEQFEPELMDELDRRGYGERADSIGITGCERQCFRPATKSIGWVGQGPDMYALKLGGSESGRHQGNFLVVDDQWYLRQVTREGVADVCATLFDWHAAEAQSNGHPEDFGGFLRRQGAVNIIGHMKSDPRTAELCEKTAPPPFLREDAELYAAV